MEAYFGVPAAGGVVHTLNLRLHPQELAFIVNHAEDRFLIVDDVLLPLWQQFKDKTKVERVFVVNHEKGGLPQDTQDYEELLSRACGDFSYPPTEEDDAAAMCFTSGTTGNSKGVLYSHRALVLHALAFALPDSLVRKLDKQGLRLIHVWGMTETTPLAVCCTLKSHMRQWPKEEQYKVRIRQGRPLPFVEVRVVNDQGEAAWDGKTLGELHVRGPWVAGSYFRAPETADP